MAYDNNLAEMVREYLSNFLKSMWKKKDVWWTWIYGK